MTPTPCRRVLLCGYYGFGNVGDELILAAILRDLSARVPGLVPTVVSGDPAATRASHGVDAVHWQDVPAIAARVRAADLVIVGGGGLFQEYAGVDPDSLFTDRHYAISFYAEPAILGALSGRPVMLYGVGVGPLASEHGRRLVRAACDAAAVVTVRDEESARLVASLGVEPARLRVTADPAWALAEGDAAGVGAALAREAPGGNGPLVAVSLRHWDIGVASYFWEKEVAAGLDAFLAANDARLLFIPFQRLSRAAENDAAVAERVLARMGRADRAAVLSGDREPAVLAALLGRCDLVVGMRLHSLVVASASGVPVVALSYDPKVDLAMAQIGAERFVVPLRDVEAGTLARRMEEALARRAATAAATREKVETLRVLARSNADAAVELLGSAPAPRPPSVAIAESVSRAVTGRLEAEAALRQERERSETALREGKERAEAEAATRGRACETAEAALEKSSTELRRALEELALRDRELGAARSETARLEAELRSTRAELGSARAELAEGAAELEQAEDELAGRDAELERTQAELVRGEDALRRARAEVDEARAALVRTGDDLGRYRAEAERLSAELGRVWDSRLWKMANRYWHFLGAIGRLPRRTAGPVR